MTNQYQIIGVMGAGAMGTGIAQVAAQAGAQVLLYDLNENILQQSSDNLLKILNRLEEKERIASATDIFSRITFVSDLGTFSKADLIIEAIVENLNIKKQVFKNLESFVSKTCVLASNTSSLSITSIASACSFPERVIGIHFFNPAPLMALVEIIPAVQTDQSITEEMLLLISQWGKSAVQAKDTPGFIVNRVARPFYSEALRIYEEGIASKEFIDAAMVQLGGFKMGPFTLMDYIGHDVNYIVTETVFNAYYYDSRYTPALTQKRLLEAGWLGRKTQRGFYTYQEALNLPSINLEEAATFKMAEEVVLRIVCMLINEAIETLYLGIANQQDLEIAMTKGVNYPKGLLAWCNELGPDFVLAKMNSLYNKYKEDRYRPSALLKEHGIMNIKF